MLASDFRYGGLELSDGPVYVRARARVAEPTLEREDDNVGMLQTHFIEHGIRESCHGSGVLTPLAWIDRTSNL